MWVYLIIGLLLIYALYKERQALGCQSNGEDCDNQNGKAVKGTSPSLNDSNQKIYHKLKLAGCYKDRFVFWRVAVIVSFICAVISWFILKQKLPCIKQSFPDEWELVILMLVISSVLYVTDSFYKFHLCDHVKKNINRSVDILQERYP